MDGLETMESILNIHTAHDSILYLPDAVSTVRSFVAIDLESSFAIQLN